MLDVRSCQREQGGPKSPKGRFCDKNADRHRGMTLGALEKKERKRVSVENVQHTSDPSRRLLAWEESVATCALRRSWRNWTTKTNAPGASLRLVLFLHRS